VPFIAPMKWSANGRQFGWQRGVPSSQSYRLGSGTFFIAEKPEKKDFMFDNFPLGYIVKYHCFYFEVISKKEEKDI
jgi:hypothetical protein